MPQMRELNILLAGEFRTGSICAPTWINQQQSVISIFTDSLSEKTAIESYPAARMIVVNDYNHITSNTRKLFERWRNYVQCSGLQDSQLVCVSRPDMYITTDIWQTVDSMLDAKLITSFDITRAFGHDAFFICSHGILRQIVDQYEEFDPDGNLFKSHDYMYFCSQKFGAKNIFIPGHILRPGYPYASRTINLLRIYNKIWHQNKFIK